MYKTILMPLDGTPTDLAIIEHIKQLAKILHSRVVLFHVATSVAAQWHGPEAGGEEVEAGQAYLDKVNELTDRLAQPWYLHPCWQGGPQLAGPAAGREVDRR